MKLEFTDQEIQILGNALGARPYAEVAVLIAKINKQMENNNGDASRAEPAEME